MGNAPKRRSAILRSEAHGFIEWVRVSSSEARSKMTARTTLFVVMGIGAVLIGGALLLVGVSVSAWYFWPAKRPDLADAGPRANVAAAEPKDKDKAEAPPAVKPPVKINFDPNIVFSISLKEPQRKVAEIFFTRTEHFQVGV